MSQFARGNAPIFNSVAEATNPASGAVMADTGAVAFRGLYDVRVIIGASATATFDVQRRNAANNANVGSVVTLYAAAGQSSEFILTYALDVGERIRVVMHASLTGTSTCAIQIEQRD
jgi:hypothetical protein